MATPRAQQARDCSKPALPVAVPSSLLSCRCCVRVCASLPPVAAQHTRPTHRRARDTHTRGRRAGNTEGTADVGARLSQPRIVRPHSVSRAPSACTGRESRPVAPADGYGKHPRCSPQSTRILAAAAGVDSRRPVRTNLLDSEGKRKGARRSVHVECAAQLLRHSAPSPTIEHSPRTHHCSPLCHWRGHSVRSSEVRPSPSFSRSVSPLLLRSVPVDPAVLHH